MMRPRPTNPFACVAALLLLMAAWGFAQTSQPASPPRALFAAASTEADWLVRPIPANEKDKDGQPRWVVLRRPLGTTEPAWSEVAAIGQRPLAIASFGERLAVLFDDNTWALIDASAQVAGPTPPAGYTLLSMIDVGDRLLFLARDGSAERKFSLFDFKGQSLSAPRAVTSVGGKAPYDPRLIEVTDKAKFTIEGAAPESGPKVAMSADGRLHAFAFNTGLFLGSASGIDSPITLPPAAVSQPLTLSHEADGSARFWWMEDGQVISRGYTLDGAAIDEAAPIAMLAPVAPPMFERGLYVVGALTLVLVLFAGGRQTIATGRPPTTKAPPRPAPLARRLAAGIIDTIPLAGCVIYLAMGDKLTIYAGMLRFDGGQSEAILTAGVLFYLVLLFAFELQWQRSIGKAIFALRVVAIDGGKPRPVALLLRNALRLVDLNVITLLFVPVTPLRQRLGDFLAGTMVVDAIDADAAAPASVTPDGRRDNK